ncbi:MAG: leucine-rich repeat protein [Butyricicoccus pullicaecorum]|nr:leucine-rich repeat protein [Butyricicoccus pullicaecorum]
MKQISSENEALLFCEQRADGIYILRCQTNDNILKLPNEIEGIPVVGLGDYVCAVREPELSGREIWKIHMTCGQDELPTHDAKAICQVILPDSLRVIGSYAFYNCYHFSRLELPAGIQEIGHGAFMNCTNFREVTLRGDAQGRTCLPELLGQVSGEIQATLHLPAGEVHLLFPPYQEQWEDLAPAHIFQRRIEGAGYPYRQCFQGGVLSLMEYDMAFERLIRIQDYETAVRVALNRLRWPVGVCALAHTAYVDCLHEHADIMIEVLLRQSDVQGVHALLRLGVLSEKEIHKACDLARQMGQTEVLGILLAAIGSTVPRAPKQYDL